MKKHGSRCLRKEIAKKLHRGFFVAALIIALSTACSGKDKIIAEPDILPSVNVEEIPSNIEPDDEDTVPSEPEHLSIAVNKIVLLDNMDYETWITDGLGRLKKKYLDLELINVDELIEVEEWRSDASGFSYRVAVFPDEINSDGTLVTTVFRMTGSAKSLINGLTAPVEISTFMELLGMSDDDWCIGEAPVGSGYQWYVPDYFNDALPTDLCFIIPDGQEPRVTPYGIKITLSKFGYVSPADPLDIGWAGYGF